MGRVGVGEGPKGGGGTESVLASGVASGRGARELSSSSSLPESASSSLSCASPDAGRITARGRGKLEILPCNR